MVNTLKKLEGFKGMVVWYAAQQYILQWDAVYKW